MSSEKERDGGVQIGRYQVRPRTDRLVSLVGKAVAGLLLYAVPAALGTVLQAVMDDPRRAIEGPGLFVAGVNAWINGGMAIVGVICVLFLGAMILDGVASLVNWLFEIERVDDAE